MDVVLAVMPFADVGRPALGVSLLKSAAEKAGFSARVEYLNFDFAELIGTELYATIASSYPSELLVGEWIFADDLFADRIPSERDYVDQLLRRYAPEAHIGLLRQARAAAGAYLDASTAAIARHRPKVVGFTSTFHQTCASLAVARRLKAGPDPPVVVFGGANCEGEMGDQLLRSFPWIDHVCSGEADVSFVELLHRITGAGGAEHGARDLVVSDPVDDLDALPYPDYDEYFARLEVASDAAAIGRQLVVETARGCWWGAKRHCTFCGLNGATMAFRSKSPARAYDEIVDLSRTYATSTVSCVDNILDPAYVDTLFPRLASAELGLNLFYEVKANLHHDQLVQLRAAGVRHIQPGIESLSDEVLRLMRKGVTAFQNVQLLRWCTELGIDCSWNILAGFPGESPDEYRWMTEAVPYLTHLQPPVSCSPIRLDRFSPLHGRAVEAGLTRVRPARAYYYVYPLNRRELGRLAYFFDFDYADGRDVQAYVEPVGRAVQQWWDAWAGPARPVLDASFDGDDIVVTDTRAIARAERQVVSGVAARILVHGDQRASWGTLCRSLQEEGRVRSDEVGDALDALVADGLVARRGNRFVTLAVFRDRPAQFSTSPRYEEALAEETIAPTPPAEPLLRLGRPA